MLSDKNNMTKYETTQKIKKTLSKKTKEEVSKMIGISRPTLDARLTFNNWKITEISHIEKIMKTVIENKLYCVEVPSDAKKLIKIKYDFNGNYMLESVCDKFKLKIPFDFKILGKSPKITFYLTSSLMLKKSEYQINGTTQSILYRDYFYPNSDRYVSDWFNDKDNSFRSLLQSKGIDLNKENVKYIILTKE